VPAVLAPETRPASLQALARDPFDLLVIGGGITGAGIARDAALRGLRTALVEANDFAAGTSSRSSKLIHGGVRYLAQGDLALVREAATERMAVKRIAPHLTEAILLVLPTSSRAGQMKMQMGLWTFDKLAGVGSDERHATWSQSEALEHEPLLARERLYGAVAFTEYLTDDARLTFGNIRSAAEAGAIVVNHAIVTALARERDGVMATIRDQLSAHTFTLQARVVVNAAGPWVDAVRALVGDRGGKHLRLTKGVHFVVPYARLPLRNGITMNAHDKRPVFALARDGMTYVGTTDTDYPTPDDYPDVTRHDIDYLLEATNRTFAIRPIVAEEIVATWAGLRPLIHEEGKKPSEVSRRDEIMTDPSTGLLSIAGGKLTAYRKMAERIVDLVGEKLGRKLPPCVTDRQPLPGGDCDPVGLERTVSARLHEYPAGASGRLVRLHGAACNAILDRMTREPELASPMPGLPTVPRAEVAHVLDEEMALTLTDVLERRLRVLLFDANQGLGGVDAVAAMAATRLGWSAEHTRREIDRYQQLAARARSFT
jgi:glycerol-3-phosphate dehydrogenase